MPAAIATLALMLTLELRWGAVARLDPAWDELRYRGRTEYSVRADSAGPVLRGEARGTNSALVRRLAPGELPARLRWRWRVLRHPDGADTAIRGGDDRAAAVFVIVKRSWLPWRTRALIYQWAPVSPDAAWSPSPYARDIRVLTLRRDPAGAEWAWEERDVRADLEAAFGRLPPAVEAIGVICDSDNTNGVAIAEFGALQCELGSR